MGVQASVPGSYWAPVLVRPEAESPPQTSMREPVHTAVWLVRAEGAAAVVMGFQVSVAASYRAPVLVKPALALSYPPQTSMCEPVHTAEPADGAPVTVMAVQVSVAGSYCAPVLVNPPNPPQTSMRDPVHTAM